MKKFKTDYYGLLPIYLNDARFMQEASQEQLEAILKPFLPYADSDSFILSGIESDPGDPNGYTGGWLVLNGKIYQVDAFVSAAPASGYHRRWTLATTYLVGGAKIPKRTLTLVDTHQVVKGIVTVYQDTLFAGAPFDLPRMVDIIANMQMPGYFTRTGDGYRLQFLKLPGGYVHMYGTLMPDMLVLGAPGGTADMAVSFPYTLDSAFKEGFDYETILTVYALAEIGSTAHVASAYKIWVAFAGGLPFTLRISVEDLVVLSYSGYHKAHIHISAILKIQ